MKGFFNYRGISLAVAAALAGAAALWALDQDGGGISDVWESHWQTGTLNASSDDDADGYNNLMEYYFNTNPLDPLSRPRVDIVSPEPTDIQISFFAPMGQWFDIEVCDDLLEGYWSSLYDFFSGNNSTMVHSEDPSGVEKRFFQVVPYGSYDGDGDGLDSFEEHLLSTDPENDDSDGDGMEDGFEYAYQFNPLSPVDGPLDTDSDQLNNALEAELGLNPRLADSDGDGIDDGDEDRDWDGLSNLQEIQTYGTDPAQPDTDLDTLPDGWEVDNNFSPTVHNSSDGNPSNDAGADPDGDGLTNSQEADHGTLANNADTDGDGVSDSVEVAQGSNPKDPNDSQPPPEGTVAVNVTFGDDSGSHSEKYRVRLIPLEGDSSGYESRYRTNRVYGQPQTDTFQLPRGSKYRVELEHAGTNLSSEDDPRPDYDYILDVDTSQGGIVLEDDEGIAGEHGESYSFYASGKSATLYVPLFEWVTPKESPVSDPDDSDDGQNEFTYDTATPGVLTIDLKVLAKPTGVAQAVGHDGVPFYERCVFALPAIGDSTFAWDEANPDGMAEASGEHLIARATYTTLPASNSDFGLKQAEFQCDGDTSVLSQGPFEVFFPRDEKNHPEYGPYPFDRPQNWYYYWSQIAGVVNIIYAGNSGVGIMAEVRGMTQWTYSVVPDKTTMFVYDQVVTKTQPYGVGEEMSGIDMFVGTTIHENQHVIQISNADALLSTTGSDSFRYGWSWNQVSHNHWQKGSDNQWGVAGTDDDGNGIIDDARSLPAFEPGNGDDVSFDHPSYMWWPISWPLPNPNNAWHPIESDAVNATDNAMNEHHNALQDWGDPGKQHETLNRWDD